MPVTRRIGVVIRARRLALGLTQEQLALMVGLSPMGLHFIEKGLRSPRMDTLERLSYGLNCNVAVLITEAATWVPPGR